MAWNTLLGSAENIVFLGEAGCGKSELAIHLALHLAGQGATVHFFDLDQTKLLFRSRDAQAQLESAGVKMHYEAQSADAPTQVGGLVPLLLDASVRTVLDVGGGDMGARLIGGFAHLLRRENTAVFYIVNPYRIWSGSIEAVDATLSGILQAARLQKVRYLLNPYLGGDMTAAEWRAGLQQGLSLLTPYVGVEAAAAPKRLYQELKDDTPLPLLAVTPCVAYPWDT